MPYVWNICSSKGHICGQDIWQSDSYISMYAIYAGINMYIYDFLPWASDVGSNFLTWIQITVLSSYCMYVKQLFATHILIWAVCPVQLHSLQDLVSNEQHLLFNKLLAFHTQFPPVSYELCTPPLCQWSWAEGRCPLAGTGELPHRLDPGELAQTNGTATLLSWGSNRGGWYPSEAMKGDTPVQAGRPASCRRTPPNVESSSGTLDTEPPHTWLSPSDRWIAGSSQRPDSLWSPVSSRMHVTFWTWIKVRGPTWCPRATCEGSKHAAPVTPLSQLQSGVFGRPVMKSRAIYDQGHHGISRQCNNPARAWWKALPWAHRQRQGTNIPAHRRPSEPEDM